jgi:hypothetical protein
VTPRFSWTRRRLVSLGLLLVLCAVVVYVADPARFRGLSTRLIAMSAATPARSHQQYVYQPNSLTASAGKVDDARPLRPGAIVLGTWRAGPDGLSTNSAPTSVTLTLYLYGPFSSAEARTQTQEGAEGRMQALERPLSPPGPVPAMTSASTTTDTWSSSDQIALLALAPELRPGLYFVEEVAHAPGAWATVSQTRLTLASVV